MQNCAWSTCPDTMVLSAMIVFRGRTSCIHFWFFLWRIPGRSSTLPISPSGGPLSDSRVSLATSRSEPFDCDNLSDVIVSLRSLIYLLDFYNVRWGNEREHKFKPNYQVISEFWFMNWVHSVQHVCLRAITFSSPSAWPHIFSELHAFFVSRWDIFLDWWFNGFGTNIGNTEFLPTKSEYFYPLQRKSKTDNYVSTLWYRSSCCHI